MFAEVHWPQVIFTLFPSSGILKISPSCVRVQQFWKPYHNVFYLLVAGKATDKLKKKYFFHHSFAGKNDRQNGPDEFAKANAETENKRFDKPSTTKDNTHRQRFRGNGGGNASTGQGQEGIELEPHRYGSIFLRLTKTSFLFCVFAQLILTIIRGRPWKGITIGAPRTVWLTGASAAVWFIKVCFGLFSSFLRVNVGVWFG